MTLLANARKTLRRSVTLLFLVAVLFLVVRPCLAYSVLTHEEIIDLLWDNQIQPLLKEKFPHATPDELKQAHAYAYGGCLVQDMGYYPFGNRQFSDLVHYVRSGDFVVALLDEAQDVNEYAFALGALAHYAADITGHPVVNAAVAREFPKLRAKYGDSVTFAQDPKAHVRTEFGFDVVQVAKQRYTPDSYHNFIGFQVSKPVLERAFFKTYGVELKDIFANVDLSISTFRHGVSKFVPEMTRVALVTKGSDMVKENPSFSRKKFLYNLKRADYERDWGKDYVKPGIGARLLAFIFRLVPKVGPFKALDVKIPSATTEDLYLKSVNNTVDEYRSYLKALRSRDVRLPNIDFDTGKKTKAGEYTLTDHAYAKLLEKLADNKYQNVSPALRDDILHFYEGGQVASNAKPKDREEWEKAIKHVEELKSSAPAAVPAALSQSF